MAFICKTKDLGAYTTSVTSLLGSQTNTISIVFKGILCEVLMLWMQVDWDACVRLTAISWSEHENRISHKIYSLISTWASLSLFLWSPGPTLKAVPWHYLRRYNYFILTLKILKLLHSALCVYKWFIVWFITCYIS